MKTRRAAILALAALCFGLASALAPASANDPIRLPVPRPATAPKTPKATIAPDQATRTAAAETGRVIVLRGLHNVWSRGMDKVAKDLEAQGVPVILANHSRWRRLADQAIADYKQNKNITPIIIVGHSLGGDAALVMSNWMVHNGVPVRLIIVLDAVAQTHPVERGIQEVVNFYKPRGYGQEVKGSKRFTGTIENIDLTERRDIDHLNIDEDPDLQAELVARTLAALKGRQSASR